MSSPIKPPVAQRIEHLTSIHNRKNWNDPYFWLRHKEDPKVMKYLEEENAYTEDQMKGTAGLRETLFQEMRGRIQEADMSVPYRRGEWYYYTRTLEGLQYPIHCRKKDDPDIGREEILVDENQLAEGKPFLDVGLVEVSPDGNILAYSVDELGNEDYEIFFKDLRTGKILDHTVRGTHLEWANDNQHVFYTRIDSTFRPYQAWRHDIEQDSEKDEIVHDETDGRFYLHLTKSLDQKYIFINSVATLTREVLFLNADEPKSKPTVFATRSQGVEYELTHSNAAWFVTTNADGAKNFKLMTVPTKDWVLDDKKKWTEVLAHRADVKLDGVDCFERFMAIWEREKGLTKLRVRNLLTNQTAGVVFPEPVYVVHPGLNYEHSVSVLSVRYSSLVTPKTVIDYNMADGTRIARKEDYVKGFDKTKFETLREYATARDGVTQIPISIVYKKGVDKTGKSPLFLYGYGSYGYSVDPSFDQRIISLLDRGIIYAIAHIRGGGEMGRSWYEAGKLLTKKNTFEDFVECARFLIAQKYTSANRLAIYGASAGGLLMGSVVNMAPELFKVAIADVPFVDVMNTMMDPSLPLVENEYEEWGNPNKKDEFDYMLSYAPYEHVEAKAYPAMLVIGGLNDPRVPFWEPVKWVAKMRTLKTDNNPLLLRTLMEQGHGGASGRFDALKEEAFYYAFVLTQLGLHKPDAL